MVKFRKKDNIIKQLETKERQRELYIKKTNEEVVRLRQLARQEVFFGCSFYFIGYSFEEIHICCYYICSHQIIFSNCIQLNIFSYWCKLQERARKNLNNSRPQSLRFGNQNANNNAKLPDLSNPIRARSTLFSLKAAKQKWMAIEKYVRPFCTCLEILDC